MKACYIETTGPPEVIVYGDLPVPELGPRDILVRVEAVAVDPVDTYIRSGAYRTELHFPHIIGRDLAGTVADTGGHVERFRPGDRVWANSLGYDGRQGAFAEYARVAEDRLYHLPDGVEAVTAVAVAHFAATAYTGLAHHAHLRPGDDIFVIGGAGNVGSAVLQIGTASGHRVIVSASGADDIAWCERWGAEAVIDHKRQDVTAEVQRLAPRGVDIHWDTTGHHDLDAAMTVLAPRGRIVVMAGLDQRPPLPVGPLYTRDASIVGFAMSAATVPELAETAATINRLLAAGKLEARIAAELPLADAAHAHRLVEGAPGQPRVHGRVVLHP